ncbi:ATP-binding protein [Blautia sp. MSJ-19]|uniref:ATP-binding protein n=1 Tax=Blautia sp. MSJ-19 TaxID=2841517 RepID=UPI001C0F2A8E|nr:transporter substrate-binding domain-containing protein [Blautia sp. MSJ-19]MBU5481133.1 transporter substrate-binding domain-containing protein [Blautia sp. MSJ-19]
MKKIKLKMYKGSCFLLCLFLLLTLFPVSVTAKSDSKVVRVGWYEGTYNTTGSNGELSGYSYEYQQTVAAYTGWTYEYVRASWSELLEMLENGEIDLMGGVSYTRERADNMLYSELPMGEDRYYLYADVSNTDISASDLTTLNGKRIGMLKEALSTTRFCEWEEKHGLYTQHVDITGAEDVHQKLADKEIDGFVLNESPQWEKENLATITVVGDSDNYFVINKNRPDLKVDIDNAMRQIEHDKPFYMDDLYKKYLSAQTFEVLTDEEQSWIEQHGAIRVGYLRSDAGVSLTDTENSEPVGIINDYIDYASDCLGNQTLKFESTGFDSQDELLQALKDDKIDMIFHVNQNPYEAEQNGIVLSNTVFEVNVAALSAKEYFDENAENTVAVSKGNLLSKWYISYNYPQWKIIEYDSSSDVEKAVQNGEADCFIAKAGQSSKLMENNKVRSVFLTKLSYSSFGVNRNHTEMLAVLNKTLKTLPYSKLSGAFSMYENAPQKVTLMEFVKDNLLVVSVGFGGTFLIILSVILYLFRKTRKALQQAEIANAAKTNFLFNMSHDIRTPMNALLGYNELMKKGLTDPKLLDYQEKIAQSGNLLLSIINNVLDMARIESGKVELDESYARVTDILEKINGVFEVEAEKKDICYTHEIDVEHQHIMCDVTKVQEIFVNLISNAVKYTPDGGKVSVKLKEVPGDKKGIVYIRTEITDTGIGMSQEFLPLLFEAFARERNTTAGKIPGTGLGMPIVKKYVEMMGGTIDVESELGKGTKFTVILPFKIAGRIYYEQAEEKNAAANRKKMIQGKHILLAEDNDLNAEIAITILEDMGLIVERVEDGIKCVARIEQEPAGSFDMIFMDIQMPNMDGYKATELIRGLSDKEKADIPIIAMTANAFEEDRRMALAKGMNEHIAKPIEVERVEEVLLSVLK